MISGKGKTLRDWYGVFFKRFGTMPDVLARQNPFLLFAAMRGDENEEEFVPQSEYQRVLYGLD